MKRLTSLIVVALLSAGSAMAQVEVGDLFNHVGAGVSFGLDGIGFEVAAPVTQWGAVRAGLSFYPTISPSFSGISYTRNGKDGEASVDAKFKKIDGKVLLDVYPFGDANSIHLTTGLFFGNDELVSVTFHEDPNAPIGGGIAIIDDKGWQWNVRAEENQLKIRLKTNPVKPYVGIGGGRAVPKGASRIGVAWALGVQFHGTPELQGWATASGANAGKSGKWMNLEADNFDFGEDFKKTADDALKIIHKVTVWPVLNIRITGRIF